MKDFIELTTKWKRDFIYIFCWIKWYVWRHALYLNLGTGKEVFQNYSYQLLLQRHCYVRYGMRLRSDGEHRRHTYYNSPIRSRLWIWRTSCWTAFYFLATMNCQTQRIRIKLKQSWTLQNLSTYISSTLGHANSSKLRLSEYKCCRTEEALCKR